MRTRPCILSTVCVPWTEDYDFDEDLFRRDIRELLSRGITNLYIMGTAGEGYALTDRQFERISRAFMEETSGSSGIRQIGIIGMSVPQITERIDAGIQLGCRSFQISLPPWGRLNDREMYSFFDSILGGYRDVEFLHYNTGRGLRELSGKECARISADHPNLVATKNSFGSILEDMDLLFNAPELCHFFTELDYAHASTHGSCGMIMSITSLNYSAATRLFDAGEHTDHAALAAIGREVREALNLLFESVSSGAHMDGAFDKIYSKARMPEYPLRLLPPYQAASDEEFDRFMAGLRVEMPSWIWDADVGAAFSQGFVG